MPRPRATVTATPEPPGRGRRAAGGPRTPPPLGVHLLRGLVGLACLAAALGLAVAASPVALVLLVPAAVALRGCPTCWLVGLVAVLSARRATP